MKSGKRKLLALILIGVSALGVLAFFPLQLSENYCCIYQKYMVVSTANEHSACCANCTGSAGEKMVPHHSPVVHDYMSSYAVPWWISIGGLFAGITIFRKKTNRGMKQSKREIIS